MTLYQTFSRLLGLCLLGLLYSFLAKIMHWPIDLEVINTFGFASIILILLRMAFRPNPDSAIYLSHPAIALFILNWVMNMNGWPNHGIIYIVMAGLFVMMTFSNHSPSNARSKDLGHFIAISGIGVFLIGILFKMMHWPGSNIVLLAGLFLLALGIFIKLVIQAK